MKFIHTLEIENSLVEKITGVELRADFGEVMIDGKQSTEEDNQIIEEKVLNFLKNSPSFKVQNFTVKRFWYISQSIAPEFKSHVPLNVSISYSIQADEQIPYELEVNSN